MLDGAVIGLMATTKFTMYVFLDNNMGWVLDGSLQLKLTYK